MICKYCRKQVCDIKTLGGSLIHVDLQPVYIRMPVSDYERRKAYIKEDGSLSSGVIVGDAYEGDCWKVYVPHVNSCEGMVRK